MDLFKDIAACVMCAAWIGGFALFFLGWTQAAKENG
jgi:hypothetical protein